jgi:hypothetical protein
MLAHDERGLGHPDGLRLHDLVRLRVFQHPVLVDSGFMREGVPADDRLVVLHREGGRVGDHPRARVSMVASIPVS